MTKKEKDEIATLHFVSLAMTKKILKQVLAYSKKKIAG
jgi:hypothetical protein